MTNPPAPSPAPSSDTPSARSSAQPSSQPLPQPTRSGFDPIAGLLALVLPGLGHLYRGETRRALYAAVGVLGLILSGLLVGGIDSIDSTNKLRSRYWFYGQALCGPTVLAIDALHQSTLKALGDPRVDRPNEIPVRRPAYPDERPATDGQGRRVWQIARGDQPPAPPSRPGVGKSGDIGPLFGLVAGMLNLILFLDALLPTRPRPIKAPKTPPRPAGPA